MKTKVFQGLLIIDGKQLEACICATSRHRVSMLTGLSVSYLADYWTITGNKEQIEAARMEPDTVLVRKLNSQGPYKAITI